MKGPEKHDSDCVEQRLAEQLRELRAFVSGRGGKLLRPLDSASDIVQSTCREVLQHRERSVPSSKAGLRRWLFLIARRKIADRLRRRRTLKREGAAHGLGAIDLDELPCLFDAGPLEAAAASEQLVRVAAALEHLAPDHRKVILLARVQGLQHAEVAVHMQRSEGAVRVLLYRALAELGEALELRTLGENIESL